jgi:hypothetical protein
MRHKLHGWGRGVGMRVLVTQTDRDSVSMLEWERKIQSVKKRDRVGSVE